MSGSEIIEFVKNNIMPHASQVKLVVTSVIAAFYLRRKNSIETSTQEFEKIKAGHMKEAADVLLESGKLTYTEYYKMSNFLKIAEMADQEFMRKTPREALPQQDFDWFVRFYEDCGNISDEDLQALWARILAEEVHEPGSYSLRTLSCLSNMSKEEALLFQRVCSASIKSGRYVLLPRCEAYLESLQITYDDIIKLEDCGLIKSDPLMTLEIGLEGDKKHGLIACSNEWVLYATKDMRIDPHRDTIDIPEYIFTVSGAELFSVIKDADSDDYSEMVEMFNEWLPQYHFVRSRILERNGDNIKYYVPISESENNERVD